MLARTKKQGHDPFNNVTVLESILIFISLSIFTFSGYLVWPSRYNILAHTSAAASFISIFVPTLILDVQKDYPGPVVQLYIWTLLVGVICFFPGVVLGFISARNIQTTFSFDVMGERLYEKRIIRLTKFLLLSGVFGLIISYIGMGFMPIFAADPIAAKLFRGPYQAPYLRVAILFRPSFFILSTIMPIACIIWYKYRSPIFFFGIVAGLFLMIASLARSGAFGGIVFAFTIIMALKSRFHFVVLMIILVGIFILSSFFYYIIGVRTFSGQENIWEVVVAGAPDIQDQLHFIDRFNENPIWTYGRTMYGGLIPGHYKWNPSVYTLSIVAPTEDINDVGSGGLRLPLPLWGYVSFQWTGVVLFCFITGILNGIFLRILKTWATKFKSELVIATATIAFGTVFGTNIVGFTLLNMYFLPPTFVMLFYLYRFKWK